MGETWLVRRVTGMRHHGGCLTAEIEAVAALPAGELGGWLTGEPLPDQGIESLPNLPALALPELERRHLNLRAEIVGPDTARILIAPAAQALAAEDASWLGIITDSADPTAVDAQTSGGVTVLSNELVELRLEHEPFSLSLHDRNTGRRVLRTAERLRQATGLPMSPPVLLEDGSATLQLEIAGDENITGFGEQFGRTVHNGKSLVLRCTDALGTATGYAYKPVPVWHSSRGYTALLNTGATVTVDVEHTRPGAMSLGVTDELIDLHVTVGETPRQRLASYTARTGRPEVPPLWAFGYWLGRCRYHSREEMLAVAGAAQQHGVPLDVLHCDPDWLVTDRLNCDFVWNTDRFGDRAQFVKDLREAGVRLSVWELPYLDPASSRYGEAQDYLIRRPDGTAAEVTGTPSPDDRPRYIVDLASPSGRRWWQEMHEPFLDDGVEVFKTDFAEGVPDGVALGDGTPPEHAHNLYPLRYNAAVSEVIRSRTGRPSLVWARSGWAGSQRYPAQWGGDPESSVAGMRSTLRGGLSFALSAPGLWSHDVGGFFGPGLTPQLYVRWTQFGALSPLMRAHGLSPREPWAFDEHTLKVARDWIRLRYSLLPYLWQVAHEAHELGLPMLRPLAVECPEDPTAELIDGQFFLGGDLLVAPVFDDGPGPVRQRCYVPAGRWTDLLTGEELDGPGWHMLEVPLERMPVLVRSGAILPRIDVGEATTVDELVDAPWELHTFGTVPATQTFIGFDRSEVEVRITGSAVESRGSQRFAASVHRHPG